MTDQLDRDAVVASLRQAFVGTEPATDLLESLGGWAAIEAAAPLLVDDPLLGPVATLVARDAGRAAGDGSEIDVLMPALSAVAAAVLETTDPGTFALGVDLLCSNAVFADLAGDGVAAKCLRLAAPPTTVQDGLAEASVVRRATALEALVRLAVSGHGSKNKLLGLLEDIHEPQPRRYAQAVVRTVTTAFDHWTLDDEVADVIDILTGVAAPKYSTSVDGSVLVRNENYRHEVAPDAAWALANISVSKALNLTTASDICTELDNALEHLAAVVVADDRQDAELLQAALRLLRNLLTSLPNGPGPKDADTWAADLDTARVIAARADEFALDTHGLNHWSGDRKSTVLQGWSRFANDLAHLGDALTRDSLYEASVVLDDLGEIYAASRTYELTLGGARDESVVAVLRPAVASGFAARAGLLRNLVDHTEALRARLAEAEDDEELRIRVTTAEQILDCARASLTAALEPPGKPDKQAADLPPLLADLLGSAPKAAEALASVPQDELIRISADLADREASTDLDPDLIVTAIRKEMLAALSASADFKEDVVSAVTTVLDQLIKFVRQRLNSQESWKSYLFDRDADEHDLHKDLYDWLCQGQLGSFTNVEVQEVGSGRVDIQIQFSGFHLYLELKADHTAIPVNGKAAYIKQTVAYEASDVRIGFLVVLRLTPPKDKSPSNHLTEYVSHTTVMMGDSPIERHVVMLEIPGNRTKPSAVR